MSGKFDAQQLVVGHWPRVGAAFMPRAAARGFVLETCMRRLLVTLADHAREDLATPAPERFTGAAAYQFLLQVTTGLNSAVPGETNVFGQFKRAWEQYRQNAERETVQALAPLIALAIRDTRAIRQRHLQGIGGASYGPLARRLLRPGEHERVLFVGAGELARSMLPFFSAYALGVWNRRAPGPAFSAASRLFPPAAGADAARWAQHVIMTTPPDPANDARWSAWLRPSAVRSVLHMGRRRDETISWPGHVAGYDLDDVFDLRRSQDSIRSLQLERARAACRERALALASPPLASARRQAVG